MGFTRITDQQIAGLAYAGASAREWAAYAQLTRYHEEGEGGHQDLCTVVAAKAAQIIGTDVSGFSKALKALTKKCFVCKDGQRLPVIEQYSRGHQGKTAVYIDNLWREADLENVAIEKPLSRRGGRNRPPIRNVEKLIGGRNEPPITQPEELIGGQFVPPIEHATDGAQQAIGGRNEPNRWAKSPELVGETDHPQYKEGRSTGLEGKDSTVNVLVSEAWEPPSLFDDEFPDISLEDLDRYYVNRYSSVRTGGFTGGDYDHGI